MKAAFALVTLVVLAVVLAVGSESGIDCNDPAVWATAQGVQHCAVTESE